MLFKTFCLIVPYTNTLYQERLKNIVRKMVHGYTKSKEGQAAYAKVGLRYDPHLQDELYDDWLRTTTADGLSNYTNHKEKELQSIKVVQVNNTDYTGEEGQDPYKHFIVYSWKHYRLDSACNVTTRTIRTGEVSYSYGPLQDY
jgi:hypothetical protein